MYTAVIQACKELPKLAVLAPSLSHSLSVTVSHRGLRECSRGGGNFPEQQQPSSASENHPLRFFYPGTSCPRSLQQYQLPGAYGRLEGSQRRPIVASVVGRGSCPHYTRYCSSTWFRFIVPRIHKLCRRAVHNNRETHIERAAGALKRHVMIHVESGETEPYRSRDKTPCAYDI